jgi:hypothetical protein
MTKRINEAKKRQKNVSAVAKNKNKKLADYSHEDLTSNMEMMRTLSRRHSLKSVEKDSVEEQVEAMTKSMRPAELAALAKQVMKELGMPAKPVIKVPTSDTRHVQLMMVDGRLKVVKHDKNPNIKLRRQYKDFFTIEGEEKAMEKLWYEMHPEEIIIAPPPPISPVKKGEIDAASSTRKDLMSEIGSR